MPSIFISSVALFWKRMIFPSEVGKMIKSPIRLFLELNPAFTPGSRTIGTVKHGPSPINFRIITFRITTFFKRKYIFGVCVSYYRPTVLISLPWKKEYLHV